MWEVPEVKPKFVRRIADELQTPLAEAMSDRPGVPGLRRSRAASLSTSSPWRWDSRAELTSSLCMQIASVLDWNAPFDAMLIQRTGIRALPGRGAAPGRGRRGDTLRISDVSPAAHGCDRVQDDVQDNLLQL